MHTWGSRGIILFILLWLLFWGWRDSAEAESNAQGALATVNEQATRVGLRIMAEGGNAVDATVAAAFALGVVDCHNSGIGGGCFFVIRLSDGKLIALDGRETAPRESHPELYMRDGRVVPERSRTGALAVGTPGALAAYASVAEKYGRLPLKQLILPAIELAENGFVVDGAFAARLATEQKKLSRFPATRDTLLHKDGSAYRQGEMLRLPDLAVTYRAIAEHGIDWFYRGPFATRVDAWMKKNGGVLTTEDFDRYRIAERTPLVSRYRNRTIVGFPPPSSGGVHVAEILNILENYNLEQASESEYTHLTTEAMKLAFADRAYWLGDPAFTRVPRGLIDPAYAKRLAEEKISTERAGNVEKHGMPPRAEEDIFGKHTTHIAAADTDGNWVALTTTVNTSFGSGVIVPGTGVLLNNQMDDFSIAPGTPNAFGLVGAEANRLEPGKRPLSSMSPTIVLENKRPVLTLGAAGGPRIITQVVLTITRVIDRKMSLREAVAAPRFHHQWRPRDLFTERGLPQAVLEDLRLRGHRLAPLDYAGATQCVGYGADGQLLGITEPRLSH